MAEVLRLRRLNAVVAALAAVLLAATLVVATSVLALHDPSLAETVIAVMTGSLALASLVEGAASAARQIRRHRRLVGLLPREAAKQHDAVVVFEDARPLAFCAGLLRPRVFVSTGAARRWSEKELTAVIDHERHHARARDCVRLLIGRAIADALFYVPGARPLADRHAGLLDLSADAAVVARGGRVSLANALLAASDDVHPERVDGLLGVAPGWALPA